MEMFAGNNYGMYIFRQGRDFMFKILQELLPEFSFCLAGGDAFVAIEVIETILGNKIGRQGAVIGAACALEKMKSGSSEFLSVLE